MNFQIGDEVIVAVDSWSGGKELGRIVIITELSERNDKPWVQSFMGEQDFRFLS